MRRCIAVLLMVIFLVPSLPVSVQAAPALTFQNNFYVKSGVETTVAGDLNVTGGVTNWGAEYSYSDLTVGSVYYLQLRYTSILTSTSGGNRSMECSLVDVYDKNRGRFVGNFSPYDSSYNYTTKTNVTRYRVRFVPSSSSGVLRVELNGRGAFSDTQTVVFSNTSASVTLQESNSVFLYFDLGQNALKLGRYTVTRSNYYSISSSFSWSQAVVPDVVPKEGYEFIGWSPSVPTTGTVSSQTFIAQYKSIAKYSVTFDAGANGSMSGQSSWLDIPDGTTFSAAGITPPTVTPVAGYSFSGWSPVYPDSSTAITQNYSFVAQYSVIPQYTVSFDADGKGTLSGKTLWTGIYSGTTFASAGVVAPVVSANEGYAFVGWSPSVPSSGTSIVRDYNFVAQYSVVETHDINFTAGAHGSLSGQASWTGIYTGTTFGAAGVSPPNVTAVKGYMFTGWSPEYPGSSGIVSSDYDFVAQYEVIPYYSVLFVTGVSGVLTGETYWPEVEGGLTFSQARVSVPTVTPARGWTFTGWSPAFPGFGAAVNQNYTFAAQYQLLPRYTITFLPGDHGTVSGQSVWPNLIHGETYGQIGVVPPDVVSDRGYAFVGWSPAFPSSNTPLIRNETFTAQYEPSLVVVEDKMSDWMDDAKEYTEVAKEAVREVSIVVDSATPVFNGVWDILPPWVLVILAISLAVVIARKVVGR